MFAHRPHPDKEPSPKDTWVERTNLVRHWQEIKDQVLDHKWYESEKAGHDVGWHKAFTNWMLHHGEKKDRNRENPEL